MIIPILIWRTTRYSINDELMLRGWWRFAIRIGKRATKPGFYVSWGWY